MSVEFGFQEWLSLFFFSFFLILAWLRPLDWRSRVIATGLGVVAILLLVGTSLDTVREVVILRPILPLLLMPMAYWQTGVFTAPINERLQTALAAMDRRILAPFEGFALPSWLKRPVHVYLEFAYLMVYPMVPSALAVLYLAGAGEHAGEFWTVVLPPAYLCYATLPFLRTLPPRSLERPRETKAPQIGIRGFNLVVVRHVTHQQNTFPSGHAACAVAVALVLLRYVTAAGVVYLVLAISIMAAAFIGRYHYAADVVLGGALALASFLTLAQ